MSQEIEANGSCLCGAVQVHARRAGLDVGLCHCRTCRQWTGGPTHSIDCGSDVTFTGEDQIGVFASSSWAERGFCKRCGTHLFYRSTGSGQYFMSAGLFDCEDRMTLTIQVFIDSKPAYYSFANETATMTGEELFAKYAPDAK